MAQLKLFDIPKNQTEFSTKEVMAITGFTKEAYAIMKNWIF